MAKARGDFSELLVRDQLVSPDQLVEARSMADVAGAKIQVAAGMYLGCVWAESLLILILARVYN